MGKYIFASHREVKWRRVTPILVSTSVSLK